MTRELTLTPVQVGTGTADKEGRLVFVGNLLVAVLVQLSEDHDEAGQWFLEHGFGSLNAPLTLIFPDLQAAEDWIEERYKQRA